MKVFIEQNKGVTRWWNSLLNKTKAVLVGENLLRKIVRRVLFTTRNFIRSAKEWTLSVKRIYRNSDTRGWIVVFSQWSWKMLYWLSEKSGTQVKCWNLSMESLEMSFKCSFWMEVRIIILLLPTMMEVLNFLSYRKPSHNLVMYTCQGNSYFFHRKNSTLSRRPSICYRNPHIELLYWGRFEFLVPGSIYVKSPPVLAPIYNFPHI